MRCPKAALIATIGVLLLTGCATPDGGPAPMVSARPDRQSPVTESAPAPREALIADIRRSYPTDSYAGLMVDGKTFVVHRVPLTDSTRLDAEIRDRHPEMLLRFADARHSLAELDRLARQIMADAADWRQRRIDVRGAAPASDGTGVTVIVDAGPGDPAATLRRHYDFPDLTVTRTSITPAVAG